MPTLTVNIQNENDLAVVEKTLYELGLDYKLDGSDGFSFTQSELDGFVKTRQDFLDGKTTARDWDDIQKDFDSAFN